MSASRLRALALFALLALVGCQEVSSLVDFDEDGSLDEDDCNDNNPEVHPLHLLVLISGAK